MRGSVLLLPLLVLAGCSKIPGVVRQSSSQLQYDLDAGEREISELEQRLSARFKEFGYKGLEVYATRAGWTNDFKAAREMLVATRKRYESDVVGVIRRNRAEDAEAIQMAIVAVNGDLAKAIHRAKVPARTLEALREASQNPSAVVSRAQGRIVELPAALPPIEEAFKDVVVRHPHKKSDLQRRIAEFKALGKSIRNEAAVVEAAYKQPNPDLLAIVQSDAKGRDLLGKYHIEGPGLVARMKSLDRSYTRTLLDMKAEYMVIFGRSSWSESSDYDESDYTYRPVYVSPERAEAIAMGNGEDISLALVELSGVNPYENMSGSQTSQQYYIQDMDLVTFHRYVEQEGPIRKETDWVKVDEDVFEKHLNHQGMEIYAKPYGAYEDEAVAVAAPPGLAFVGNSTYGRWSTVGGGPRWVWHPAYSFYGDMYSGRHYYDRDDWAFWNSRYRNRQAWYGKRREEDEETYGTNGRYTRAYLGDSNWQRVGRSSRWDVSLRNLGPDYRGGGPGGGGK